MLVFYRRIAWSDERRGNLNLGAPQILLSAELVVASASIKWSGFLREGFSSPRFHELRLLVLFTHVAETRQGHRENIPP